MKKFIVMFFLFSFAIARQARADDAYIAIGSSIKFDGGRVCELDKTPRYAVESYDRSALMVSETGYVTKDALEHCQPGKVMHVLSIPSGVGVLSDINLSKGIYISLDVVDVNPLSYLATVAQIGSSKNIVSINGAYVVGKKLSYLRRFAFGGNGDVGSSIISLDGRFVVPNGQPDCSENAYPGVWDIKNNKRITVDDDECSNIFKR